MRKGKIKLITSLVAAAMAITLFPFNTVNAMGGNNEVSLVSASTGGSLNVSLECNGADILKETNPTIEYGDQLVCSVDWAFPNTFKLTTDDILVYSLPTFISFEQKSGDIWDGENDIGDYEITGSQIRLNYTDPVFCAQQSRIGHLAFQGSVEKNPAGGQDPVDVQLIFEGVADLTVHLQPKQVVASLELDKVFKLEDKDSHVYNCWISIKATGDQTNISVVDTMWPGMDLYNGTMPKIFNDLSQTTEFTDYTGFAFQPGDGRTFSTVINNLSDGQTVYVMYQVQVRDDMFDAALGQKYVEDNGYTGTDNYYPYGYEGVIPNRVTVSSDQVTQKVQKTTDIYGSGYSFVKWRAKEVGDEFTYGIVRWQLYINALDSNSTISSGYIIDTLPENFSYIDGSTTMYNDDNYSGYSVDSQVQITTYVDSNGRNVIRYDFTPEMIDNLKKVQNGIMIEYKTHIDAHTDDSKQYVNTATLYYDGAPDSTKSADFYYTAPAAVAKSGEYNQATAPYADYVIRVNPAALDLDPNSSTLTLTDTMGSALDLVSGSVVVKDENGNVVPNDTLTYDPATHTFTLTLNDSTFYEVTYSAIVNLVPGATLDDTNAVNTCALTGVVTNGGDGDFVIKSSVYNNSASSSSVAGAATLNIIKHDDDSTTDTLANAGFTVQSLTVDSNNNVTAMTDLASGTTGADGRLSINNIVRGTYYMITETQAPSGYELDPTPKFIVFAADATTTYTSKLTYNGTDYDVEVISAIKASFDLYIANSESVMTASPVPTEPAAPVVSDEPSEPAAPVVSVEPSEPTPAPAVPAETTPEPADTLVAGATMAKEVPATGEEGDTMALAGALVLASAALTVAVCVRRSKKETK